jgi:hypothetical protein
MAKDMGRKYYALKILNMVAIVAKMQAAATSSCALATIKEAVANIARVFIGYQTPEYYLKHNKPMPHILATNYYNINT